MDKQVLRTYSRDPLFGLDEQGCLSIIKEKLEGRAMSAYIFGSFGTPEFGKYSDIDLLIVCDTSQPFTERAHEFFDLRESLPSLEMFVYTPDEFAGLTSNPTKGFWKSVTSSMRKIL